jgi:hypothetical protein
LNSFYPLQKNQSLSVLAEAGHLKGARLSRFSHEGTAVVCNQQAAVGCLILGRRLSSTIQRFLARIVVEPIAVLVLPTVDPHDWTATRSELLFSFRCEGRKLGFVCDGKQLHAVGSAVVFSLGIVEATSLKAGSFEVDAIGVVEVRSFVTRVSSLCRRRWYGD